MNDRQRFIPGLNLTSNAQGGRSFADSEVSRVICASSLAADSSLTLSEHFHQYFTVSLAETPEERFKAYQLRFRVYCEEFGYLDPRNRPDSEYKSRIEVDEFDDRSLHCVVTHRPTGQVAGCARVVTTRENLHEDPLPLEKFCLPALSLGSMGPLSQREEVGEISRLAVDPQFRRLMGENGEQYGTVSPVVPAHEQEVKYFSIIAMAALMGATASLEMLGLTEMFAMMNPALPRLISRTGLMFERAGQVTEYHGKRAPYQMSVEAFQQNLIGPYAELYEQLRCCLGGGVTLQLPNTATARCGSIAAIAGVK